MEKYLVSGMVKGIGSVYSKKLIARFGEELFEVIEKTPNSLEQGEGIGPKRKEKKQTISPRNPKAHKPSSNWANVFIPERPSTCPFLRLSVLANSPDSRNPEPQSSATTVSPLLIV
jgi:hypothetical protein